MDVLKKVVEVLRDGGVIHLSTSSGNFVLLDKKLKRADDQPTLAEFLALREKDLKYVGGMKDGSPLNGPVDLYKLKGNPPKDSRRKHGKK